jgi:hypothetical protein
MMIQELNWFWNNKAPSNYALHQTAKPLRGLAPLAVARRP